MQTYFLTYLLIQNRGGRATTDWGGNIGFFDAVIAFIAITVFWSIITWIIAQFQTIAERKEEKKLMINRNNWEKKIEQKWKTERKLEKNNNLRKENEQFELENDCKPPSPFIDMDSIDSEWNIKKETIFKSEREKIILEYRKNRTFKTE